MKIVKTKMDDIFTVLQQSLSSGEMQSSCLIFLILEDSELKQLSTLFSDALFLNTSKLLAERLITMSRREREANVASALKSIVLAGDNMCYLQRIQLLFARELNINPVKLLQQLSRKKPIVAVWPGGLDCSNLYYATPGHSEYVSYQLSEFQDVQVISTCEHGVTK